MTAAAALCLFLLLVAAIGSRERAEAAVEVVATIPVLKDFAQQVGGAHVHVTSLLTGLESEHTYSPKPSDVVAVRHAHLLLQVGLGLEVWVDALVKNAGNRTLTVVTTSKGIALIRDHEREETAGVHGDEDHRAGNPHVWLDPENAKTMLRHITEALSKVDPGHAAEYRDNQAAYLRELDQVQTDLIERVKRLPDRRLIAYHPAWPYFARRFGFTIVEHIVTQAGAEPSAHHLQRLVKRIRAGRLKAIVSEPQMNQKVPEMLARETGIRIVVLSALPGGLPGTERYLDFLRYNVTQLIAALDRP
ncbi:metal ABC transporter substrate-binding protein [Candidatus Nitrospira bockiana]